MNYIEIVGGSKSKKELAEKVTVWYLKKVMPRMNTLDITIKLTKCYNKGAYGYCMEGEHNREFEIEIDKNLEKYDFVSTLCHELTHLKQYARREMKQLDYGVTRWKQEYYSEDVAYDDKPWEIEAFAVQDKLAKQCIEEAL